MTRLRYRAASAIEAIVGRRTLVRGSRFLLDYGRRDWPNRMDSNGEWLVQDTVLAASQNRPMVVFDVGANVGAWTYRILTAARAAHIALYVHAFEPAEATFEQLKRALPPSMGSEVTLIHSAVSNHGGQGVLYKFHELAGSNSLHGAAGSTMGMIPEAIDLCTLDQYCAEAGIDTIDLLKVDTEGHDLIVLEGARRLLERRAIELIQFEYNHRWIGARRYLKDAFDHLCPLGYVIGKVTPRAIEWYEAWSEELETFREGNYVACRPSWQQRFDALPWWRALSATAMQDHKLSDHLEPKEI